MTVRPTRVARLLQQFARFPEPGAVKMRLAAAIGAAAACSVHEELLERTSRCLVASRLAPSELWLDRAGIHPLLDRLRTLGMAGPLVQSGADLGERMHGALRDGLERAAAVVLVGSDCPDLDATYLEAAFHALQRNDVVLGPADDGGYVLIGCRRLCAGMFRGIAWGGDRVLRDSVAAAEAAGLKVATLAARYDIDRVEDLHRWRNAVATGRENAL